MKYISERYLELWFLIVYICHMIVLTEKTIAAIKEDKQLKRKLVSVLDCTERMLHNYLVDNSRRFTELDVINTLVDHMQLPVSEIITGGKLSKLLSK